MAKLGVKVPWKYRSIVFLAIMLSWCTGVGYFTFKQWIRVAGDFGPEIHPVQTLLREIHGIGAFIMMVLFGFLLASHVSVSWKTKRHRFFGIGIIMVVLTLMVTGYVIYYAVRDEVIDFVTPLHTIVGTLLPLFLVLHIITGILSRGKKSRKGKSSIR